MPIIETIVLCSVYLNGSVNCVPMDGPFKDDTATESSYAACKRQGNFQLLMAKKKTGNAAGKTQIAYYCASGEVKVGWNE